MKNKKKKKASRKKTRKKPVNELKKKQTGKKSGRKVAAAIKKKRSKRKASNPKKKKTKIKRAKRKKEKTEKTGTRIKSSRDVSGEEAQNKGEKETETTPLLDQEVKTSSVMVEIPEEIPNVPPENPDLVSLEAATKVAPAGDKSIDPQEFFDELEQEAGQGGEEEAGDKTESGVERLVFSLGPEEYAVELTGIQEIIRHVEITPVPRSEETITGVISLRGTVIPIYDLRKRLGLDMGEVSRQTRILVAKLEKGVVGLIVDRVSGVVMIPDRLVEPPPSNSGGSSSEHLRGVATLSGRMLILLNLEKAITLNA